jgi:glutamate dehydrogenase
MRPVFVFRAAEDSGASVDQVVRAYTIARDIFDIPSIWNALEAADDSVPPELQYDVMFQTTRMLRRAVHWLLREYPGKLDIGALVTKMRPMAAEVTNRLLDLAASAGRRELRKEIAQLVEMGLDPKLAHRVAALSELTQTLDIIQVADSHGLEVTKTAQLYFGLGQGLELNWIRKAIEKLAADGRWQAVARDALRQHLAQRQTAVLNKLLASRGRRSPQRAIVDWLEANKKDIARVRQIVQDMRSTEVADFATLSVAIGELERLT